MAEISIELITLNASKSVHKLHRACILGWIKINAII